MTSSSVSSLPTDWAAAIVLPSNSKLMGDKANRPLGGSKRVISMTSPQVRKPVNVVLIIL